MNEFQANSDATDAAELQWEIDRFILGDPDFDHLRFEERMRDDEELALRVASSVHHLQAVQAAVRQDQPVLASPQAKSPAWTSPGIRAAVLAMCVMLLVAVFYPSSRQGGANSVSDEQTLSLVASNWVALGAAESPFPGSEVVRTAAHNIISEESTEEELYSEYLESPDGTGEQNDWMLNAAADFYAELEG